MKREKVFFLISVAFSLSLSCRSSLVTFALTTFFLLSSLSPIPLPFHPYANFQPKRSPKKKKKDDAVSFLKRAHAALKPSGVLVVKENVCSTGFVVDDSDRSLTRSHAYMLGLFERAGVSVSRHARQRDLPKGLFGVRMYACVSKAEEE